MATPESRQRHREAQSRWLEKNHDQQMSAQSRWYRKNAQKVAAQRSLQRYGVTEEQRQQMEQDQKGLCAICHQPPPAKKPKLHTDHDHKTGKARKLLCARCNLMLGMALENPDVLRAGAEYLEAHR